MSIAEQEPPAQTPELKIRKSRIEDQNLKKNMYMVGLGIYIFQ